MNVLDLASCISMYFGMASVRCVRGLKPLIVKQSAQRRKLGLGFSNMFYIWCLNQIKSEANIPYYPASPLKKGELSLGDILVPLIGFGFQSVCTLTIAKESSVYSAESNPSHPLLFLS